MATRCAASAAATAEAEAGRARPLSICLVAHAAYGALAGGATGELGGVERQVSLLGRWLAARGHRVALVVWDQGQTRDQMIDGVRVITLCREEAGVPGLRFLWPRWTSLARALRRADAELYYHNCCEYVTGQVALWCRRNRRAFVYSVASDAACSPALPKLKSRRERILYRYGLTHATGVAVQSETQRRMLQDHFGVQAGVLPMPCPAPEAAGGVGPSPERGRVLWVGRISEEKRPQLLLDVAERLPELGFDVVGKANRGAALAAAFRERAAGLANVRLHGMVERAAMGACYTRSALLCCTSLYEGFPNTFLEAWSHGLPVVSSFDPDGLIARLGLGRAAGDANALAGAIRELLARPEEWRRAAARAREYYLRHHTPGRAMPLFEAFFRAAVERHGR